MEEPRITFDELRKFAESRWPNHIETSLLGGVRTKKVDNELTGAIPDWISRGAQQHGLEVLIADFRRGTYSFRLITPPNA